LLLVEALKPRFRELQVQRDPACAACGDTPTVTSLVDYEAYCGIGSAHHAGVALVAAREVAGRRSDAAAPLVVDVREPWEWQIAHIEGSRLIPLGELAARLRELDPRAEIVTVCHKGSRSLMAQQLLQGAGFHARSLAGGIDAWAQEVEPDMARY